MGRMLLTVQQTGSAIRCHQRWNVEQILQRGLGLGGIGRTAQVPDTPLTRGMLLRVKHIVDVIYMQIDIRWLADQVCAEYQDIIVGPNNRIRRGQVLWDAFETAFADCLADPNSDDRRLTECVNEIAVAAVLARDRALQDSKIEYEPALLRDGRKIDFVVDRGADNLYVEVKTVRPNAADSDEAWQKYLRLREFHPQRVDYIVTREGMGGKIYENEFASRSHFLEYTLAFEERLAAAKAIKPGPGVIVFCGNGFAWRLSQLEDFVDFYRTGAHRDDDPFGPMEDHNIKKKEIELLRNVDGFAFLRRPVDEAQKQEFHFPVQGPKFGAAVPQPMSKSS